MENTKFIIYNDKKYWVSGTGQYFYYCPYKNGIRQTRIALHRQIWKDNNGEIPPQHHVHHVDGNPLNNDPSNLVCILGSKHNSEHATQYTKENPERVMLALQKAQDKARDWHKSKEGLAWHSANAKSMWVHKKPRKVICENCGKEYESTCTKAKFCSNNCAQGFYYRTKKHHEDRECVICGQTFSVRSNEHTKTCSRSCAAKLRWRS